MSAEEIGALEVQYIVQPDAILFLWCPSVFILDGTGTRVARAWGFEPKQLFTWEKDKIGLGNYFRNCTEHAILASRGRGSKLIGDRSIRTIVQAPRGEHSEKPEVVYDLLDRLVPEGARLELFARRQRPGWECWGLECPEAPVVVIDDETPPCVVKEEARDFADHVEEIAYKHHGCSAEDWDRDFGGYEP